MQVLQEQQMLNFSFPERPFNTDRAPTVQAWPSYGCGHLGHLCSSVTGCRHKGVYIFPTIYNLFSMTDFTTSIFHVNKGPAFSACKCGQRANISYRWVVFGWLRLYKPCRTHTICIRCTPISLALPEELTQHSIRPKLKHKIYARHHWCSRCALWHHNSL